MNNCSFVGRLTKDPELRYTQSGKGVVGFTMAVDRRFSKEKEADFFQFTAWDKAAETIATYVRKGDQLAVTARAESGSYDHQDGHKVYTLKFIVDSFTFISNGRKNQNQGSGSNFEDFTDLQPIDEGDIPF